MQNNVYYINFNFKLLTKVCTETIFFKNSVYYI